MPAKKIQFQTGGFDPFLFHRWQIALGIAVWSSGSVSYQAAPTELRPTNIFLSVMLGENHDWRVYFYQPLSDFWSVKVKGQILVITGGNVVERIGTNDYPTVDAVLKRKGFVRPPSQPQLRVVQQNRILQKGFAKDDSLREELLGLRLSAGDVVIFSRVE
jgi:hypothetical protein